MKIKREAPTEKDLAQRHDEWRRIASQLMETPDEWFRIKKDDPSRSLASNIRRGQLRAFRPAGSFEATMRTKNGKVRVYARFVGGGNDV